MLRIDFIGVGTGKAATTWIHQCLKEHPDVCFSEPKETYFFHKNNSPTKYINSHYKHCSEKSIKGEFSNRYMYDEQALKKIHKLYPKVKILISLRDPVDRAISLYYYRKSKRPNMPELEDIIERKSRPFLEEGLYGKYIKKVFNIFPKENVHIIFYKDIKEDPKKVVSGLYSFLNIDENFLPPSIKDRVNVTTKNKKRFPKLETFVLKTNNLLNNNYFGKIIKSILTTTGLSKITIYALKVNTKKGKNIRSLGKKPINPETLTYLKNYFTADVKRLEKILEIDLSGWLKQKPQ